MASGRLAAENLVANTLTDMYSCPEANFAVVNISFVNRLNQQQALRIAITKEVAPNAPVISEYIEYDTELSPNGVFEKTNVVMGYGDRIVCWASAGEMSAVITGIETPTGQLLSGIQAPVLANVFDNRVFAGSMAAQTIATGIDITNNTGFVLTKDASSTTEAAVLSTTWGTGYYQRATLGPAQADTQSVIQILATGYDVEASPVTNNLDQGAHSRTDGSNMITTAFRKNQRFMDVQTWVGNGAANRVITHDLGEEPSMVFVMCYNQAVRNTLWHRNFDNLQYKDLSRQTGTTGYATDTTVFPNRTLMTNESILVGNNARTNALNHNYIAYIFAHDTASSGVIRGGSFDCTNSAGTVTVTLGWEPQYLFTIDSHDGEIRIYDAQRGTQFHHTLRAEVEQQDVTFRPTFNSTGFTFTDSPPTSDSRSIRYVAIKAE